MQSPRALAGAGVGADFDSAACTNRHTLSSELEDHERVRDLLRSRPRIVRRRRRRRLEIRRHREHVMRLGSSVMVRAPNCVMTLPTTLYLSGESSWMTETNPSRHDAKDQPGARIEAVAIGIAADRRGRHHLAGVRVDHHHHLVARRKQRGGAPCPWPCPKDLRRAPAAKCPSPPASWCRTRRWRSCLRGSRTCCPCRPARLPPACRPDPPCPPPCRWPRRSPWRSTLRPLNVKTRLVTGS